MEDRQLMMGMIETNSNAIDLLIKYHNRNDELTILCMNIYRWFDRKNKLSKMEKHWKTQLEFILDI